MTNFFVTYTAADKRDIDGYYKEIVSRGIAEKSRAEDGCEKYEYYYPAEAENKLFLWERWASVDHQKVHCQTEHFAELAELKEKYGISSEIIVEEAK